MIRRNFIGQTLTATAGLTVLPALGSAAEDHPIHKKIRLPENAVILFQGDSITDVGRDRAVFDYNNLAQLGGGYPNLVAAKLLFDHPEKKIKIYNKGCSGDRIFNLSGRWERDTFALKPDVLSILVGVNDFWRTIDQNDKGTFKTYYEGYVQLMERTKKRLPDTQLIIAEPFAVNGVRSVDDKWFPVFNEYRAAAQKVADQFDAVFIPLQELFDTAQKAMPGSFWTRDGVHPTLAGAQIMASAWLSCFK